MSDTCEHGMPHAMGCDDCTIRRLHEARKQDRRAMREALEALEKSTVTGHYECRCEGRDHWPHCYWKKHQNALAHLRQRLEQP